jgi:hypothetical protein
MLECKPNLTGSTADKTDEGCFGCCLQLADVTFEKGSQIETVGDAAFLNCSELALICVRSSIETVSPTCFGEGSTLRCVLVETGWQLSRGRNAIVEIWKSIRTRMYIVHYCVGRSPQIAKLCVEQ